MTQLAHAQDLERVEAPSAEEFQREFVEKNRPVVITGVANTWPAFERWTPQYLRDTAGDSPVTVHYEESGNFQRWYTPEGRDDRTLPLREFLDILESDEHRRYYMSEHDLSLISKKLCADTGTSRYTDGEPKMFLGRDTCMPLHYHATTEAILCQIEGSKEILLYSPEQFPLLYAHPWRSPAWMFSRVDGRLQVKSFTRDIEHLRLDAPTNGDDFPKFKKAKPTVVKLEAGEILFIPVHWWHLTTCPGFQVNVSAFWKSVRRRYTFPQPGFQVLAHEWYFKLRRKLRGKPAAAAAMS
ncbi:MAG: cupin-like domain-containing protein [Planctomycetota bacterium]